MFYFEVNQISALSALVLLLKQPIIDVYFCTVHTINRALRLEIARYYYCLAQKVRSSFRPPQKYKTVAKSKQSSLE